jgi:hypothetical protein
MKRLLASTLVIISTVGSMVVMPLEANAAPKPVKTNFTKMSEWDVKETLLLTAFRISEKGVKVIRRKIELVIFDDRVDTVGDLT